jgi:16S rRNA (guanine1516-N2)-methyltransferase
LGASVVMFVRSPAFARVLEGGLARARAAGPDYAVIAGRMRLIQGDAREILPTLHPDVVLVDPMHPARGNSALVKQEMRLLRETVGDDRDAGELMGAALAAAGQRVVLKWPVHASLLPGLPPPSHSITGKSTRYDVFMTHRR